MDILLFCNTLWIYSTPLVLAQKYLSQLSVTHWSLGVGGTGAMKPSGVRGQDETYASVLTGVRQTRVWERDGHLETSYLTPVECVLVLGSWACAKITGRFHCVLLYVYDKDKERKLMREGMRERERQLTQAESLLPLMLAWHVTFPDVHVHTVLRSICQPWPSSTSRPSHTHRCLTHSHPSRYCTRDCRSAFCTKRKIWLYHITWHSYF